MIYATCGFLFDQKGSNVALIRKKRPEFQARLLNGIGGKCDFLENALRCQVREFKEETGVAVESWRHFATLRTGEWQVFFYSARDWALEYVRTTTDEEVGIYGVREILGGGYTVMPNLSWLIPMALQESISRADIYEEAL